jgi:hypothetical protein
MMPQPLLTCLHDLQCRLLTSSTLAIWVDMPARLKIGSSNRSRRMAYYQKQVQIHRPAKGERKGESCGGFSKRTVGKLGGELVERLGAWQVSELLDVFCRRC